VDLFSVMFIKMQVVFLQVLWKDSAAFAREV